MCVRTYVGVGGVVVVVVVLPSAATASASEGGCTDRAAYTLTLLLLYNCPFLILGVTPILLCMANITPFIVICDSRHRTCAKSDFLVEIATVTVLFSSLDTRSSNMFCYSAP